MYTRKELASFFGVHPETLTKLIRSIGITHRDSLTHPEFLLLKQSVCNPLYFKITRLKLAKWYNVHPESFSKYLKNWGINHNRKLKIKEIDIIYKHCGIPYEVMTTPQPAENPSTLAKRVINKSRKFLE